MLFSCDTVIRHRHAGSWRYHRYLAFRSWNEGYFDVVTAGALMTLKKKTAPTIDTLTESTPYVNVNVGQLVSFEFLFMSIIMCKCMT